MRIVDITKKTFLEDTADHQKTNFVAGQRYNRSTKSPSLLLTDAVSRTTCLMSDSICASVLIHEENIIIGLNNPKESNEIRSVNKLVINPESHGIVVDNYIDKFCTNYNDPERHQYSIEYWKEVIESVYNVIFLTSGYHKKIYKKWDFPIENSSKYSEENIDLRSRWFSLLSHWFQTGNIFLFFQGKDMSSHVSSIENLHLYSEYQSTCEKKEFTQILAMELYNRLLTVEQKIQESIEAKNITFI